MIAPNTPMPASEEQLSAFLAAFEACTIPKSEWTHAAHVLVGSAYLHMLGEAAAINTMRDRVKAFNLAVGGQNTPTSGYHETLTIFWIKILSALRAQNTRLDRLPFAALAVHRFGHRSRLHQSFYNYDVLNSPETRRNWAEPTRDLREALAV